MIKISRLYCRIFAFSLLLVANLSAIAGVEPYRNQLKGGIKKGDSIVVKDEKFRTPAFNWSQIERQTVKNIISFRLTYDTAVVLKKAFTCDLDLKVEYYSNPDQAEPITLDNVKLKVNFSPDSGATYKMQDVYNFSNGYWVKIIVNNISSPELGDSIPPILELSGQVIVDRKYRYQPDQHISLFGNFGQQGQMMAQRLAGGNMSADNLHISWTTVPGAEEYDIEWAVFDQGTEHQPVLQQALTNQPVDPVELDKLFRNNATRITTGKLTSDYFISMVYNAKYIMVRIRSVEYEINGYRKEGNWDYKMDDPDAYAIWDISWHQQNLNWQYSAVFAEEGKKKEVVSYLDGTLRSRQIVTLNNSDNIAVVQETIYDEFGRPAANILPAPHPENKLQYFKDFNWNRTNTAAYDYINLKGSVGILCENKPEELGSQSKAAKYYSAANPFMYLTTYNKYVPDAEGYPLSVTQYVNDNTGRIRLQGGVGKKFQPGMTDRHITKFYYGRPEPWELDRLFGNDVGFANRYTKNMVIDPNGQISISYLNASGKTIATALAGEPTTTGISPLPGKPVPQYTSIVVATPRQFVFDETALSLTATTTYVNSILNNTANFQYDYAKLIYTYQGNGFKICSNCYYDLTIKVTNDCGQPVYQSTGTGIGSKISNCNDQFVSLNNFSVQFDEIGEYYISFELKLSKQVIEDYTDNYIAQNNDLRKEMDFVLDYLYSTDFTGCFAECTTCEIALGTETQFREAIQSKLSEYSVVAGARTQELETFITNLYNQLRANCLNSKATCMVSSCSRYEKQMLQDVSPGGQYALFKPDPFTPLEQDINVLSNKWRIVFPEENPGGINYEANAFVLEDGTKTSPNDHAFTLEMLVKYWNEEWATRFLIYHPEKCKLDFCNANNSYMMWDDQVKTFYKKATDIPNIPQTTGLQYSYTNGAWLLAQDPFFKAGAPGATYYSQMQDDLNLFSNRIMGITEPAATVKGVTQVVDYMLYCADVSGSTNTGTPGNSWNNCSPAANCRIPDREWQLYSDLYFQLKEKYYQQSRNAGACANACPVGTPYSALPACAVAQDFTLEETNESCQGGRLVKITYTKGTVIRPMTIDLYYSPEYSALNPPLSAAFTVGQSTQTICVPPSIPVSTIKIKLITCTANAAPQPCQGPNSGQLTLPAGGIMTGTGKFEVTNFSTGVSTSYTLVPGRADQPPADATYCSGGTVTSKQFYNCYKVFLPGGAAVDFSNVWVIACEKNLCANEPVHALSHATGYYQYYNITDGKYYFVMLQNGGGGTPSCSYDPPVYQTCLKVQVTGQPVQLYYNAALVSCNACADPFGITPASYLGDNTWQMADGVIYKVFPNTASGYVPPTNGCSNPSYYWQPCFSVTLNGNTEYYANATVLTCYEDFDPCASPPVMEMTHRYGENHYFYMSGGYQADYYIVDGDPNFPPSGEEYCVNTDMGFYDCITFEVPGQSSQSYYNVWVIACPFWARMAQTSLAGDTTTTTLRSGDIKLYRSYEDNARSATYLIKKMDAKDNAALKKALRPKRGFASYKFYKQFTLRKSPKTYQRFQNVWVARNIPRLNVKTIATKKSAKTTTATAVASSSLVGPCGSEQVEFTVGNIGYVNECGSEQLSVSLVQGEALCDGQYAYVNVYMVDKQFHNMEEVGFVIIGPGQYSTTLCISHETAERAEYFGGCGTITGTCDPGGPGEPGCPEGYKYKKSNFPEFNFQFNLSSQDLANLQNENLALLQDQINTSCEAQADGWIAKMEECISAYPEGQRESMRNALRAGFIAVCKRGGDITHPLGASTTRPGEANPSSFKQVIQSVFQLGSSLTMTCNPWLIDEPHPYEPLSQAVPKTLSVTNADLCGRLQQLRTQRDNESPGTNFYTYLVNRYGGAMNLTSAQLDKFVKSCDNCRFLLEEEIPLPVFMEPGAVGCITRAEYNNAKAALEAELGANFNTSHTNYPTMLANFINHRFGFAMSLSRYEDYEATAQSQPDAILCNQPPFVSIEPDLYTCLKSQVTIAIINGRRDYETYIVEEKRKFRVNYVTTCKALQFQASASAQQQIYHYTLYYYDQAGNLVRTVSPAGVRTLEGLDAGLVGDFRQFDPASCTGAGIPSVSNKTATFNALSTYLQNGNMKTLEMWLKTNTAEETRHVRIITPDNKYLYQTAIHEGLLWVELYTLQPTPVLTNRVVADISAVNLQPWSHLVVTTPTNFTTGALTVFLENRRLNNITSGQPPYPFAWTPGSPLPAEEITSLKHLRIYNQQAFDLYVYNNFKNSCMYPQSPLTAALLHWGRFNIPALCNQATETRVVNNQGAMQVTDNLGMGGNRFPTIKDNFTVELWVNPTQPHQIDQQLQSGAEGTDGQHYVIYPASGGSSGGSSMGISVGTNGVSVYEHADAYMPALLVWEGTISAWTHVAVVYNNKVPTLYINGQPVKTGLPSLMQFVNPGSNISSGPYGFMQGGIDEVRVWSVARTAAEILNNYNRSISPALPGIVAYWPLTKQDGSDLADLSCNGYIISPATAGFTWNTNSLPQSLTDIVPVEYAIRSIYPSHKLLVNYAYNSAGSVIQQKSPDGGESYFWHDRLGRPIASQNEEQRVNGNRYNYTVYEPLLGRVKEVGEKTGAAPLPATPGFTTEQSITNFLGSGSNSQINETVYDDKPAPGSGVQVGLTQNNLRKRVSASFYRETSGGPVLNASYYDYDLLGNVKTLWQQVEGLDLRRIDYDYDLISGKANQVHYQAGQNDQFYYDYQYDAENRIVEVRTGTELFAGSLTNAQTDASYRYYYHGPLARMVLSQNTVQGIDYAYTLQGWLKGVNSDKLNATDDMGQDGQPFKPAKDVFAFALGYYNDDYKPIDAAAKPFSLKYGSLSGDITGNELFNGSISHTTLAISRFRNGDPVGYTYAYDQLNRLVKMRYHLLTGTTTNWNSSTIRKAYQEDISYDANGNIKTYFRNGANLNELVKDMDNLTYGYNTATDAITLQPYLINNRLRHIKEDATIPSANYIEDLEDQQDDYYQYDRIGNLIQEGDQKITWNVYGKIKSIIKGEESNPAKTIYYSYDAVGNRVRKQVTANGETTTTWYVRDAKGNVLGLYSQKGSNPLKWKEQHLYGGSRLGMWHPDIEVTTVTGSSVWTTIGKKSYELTNHLGNVLAVITDKKMALPNNSWQADVITAHDYYPFGMQMPGRSIDASDRNEVVQDLTQLIVASDLNSGITPLSNNRYLHNGVTWQQQASGIVSVVNGSFRVENSGLSGSDGMLVVVPSSMIEPFTTYMMECDILEQSPGITEYNIQALSQTGDSYRVSILQSGTGHRSIVFTTGASVGNFVALRISARPSTAGLYFIVDNFVFKKYQVVNQTPLHVTDFNSAAMSGVNVNDNGQLWMPLNESITSLSVIGTTDKKIQVNGSNFNESYLIKELPIEGGKPHLLKFTVSQPSTDKRLYLQLKVRTGTGAWQFTDQRGFFYLGSGDFQLNFTLPDGIDQVRIEFLRLDPGIPVESYTMDNFSLIRMETVLSQTPGCHEVVQDLTELKGSSDLNEGAVQNGTEVNHNGVRWGRMTTTSTITLYNQAIKCENGGGGSDGVIAYIPTNGIEANATYIMEFDIIDKSPTITYFNCQAHTNGDAPYRVMARKTGVGHHSLIFTTPSLLPQYIRLRISANQIGVGTWFVVDNFVARKYQVVNESEAINTDFNEAVVDGITVNSDGMAWSNFNTTANSISLTGTTDKKLMVTCTNVEESRIKGDFDLAGGANYILRFSMAQGIEDKRLNLRMYSYANGVWTSIESLTSIYMRSGSQIFNFTHPVGATRLRLEFLRSNSGEAYDGYNVPYTLDDISISRIEPIASQTTIVCDPDTDPNPGTGPDPSGENSIYRYGFNGQEKSNEIKGNGNSYTAEFWEYDPRVGRRWNVDPVTIGTTSPYQAFAGNPLIYVDPLGLDTVNSSKKAGNGDVLQHRNKKSYFYWNKTGNGWVGNGSSEYLDPVYVRAKGRRYIKFMHFPKIDKGQLALNDMMLARMRDLKEGEQLVRPGDPPQVAEQLQFHIRNYKAHQDGRMLQMIFVGGMAAPVAVMGAIESGAGYYLYQGGSYLYRGGTVAVRWAVKSGWGGEFAKEFAKKALASRGDFSKIDWSDVLVSTVASKLKFGFWGKVGVEAFNATNDLTIKKGFQNTFLGSKDLSLTVMDGVFGYLKLGVGEIGKGLNQSPDNMKLFLDQVKGILKDGFPK